MPPNVCCGQRDPLLDGAVIVRAARQEWPDSRLDPRLGMPLLSGRRDGPYAYGPFKELTWRSQDSGVVRSTPLVDWPPAAMLALVHRERIPVPPCYGWPRGLQVGPGPWPARQGTASIEQGYEEVWSIDPDIVRGAAEYLPSAIRWLESTGRS